jgi:hypothetical protein
MRAEERAAELFGCNRQICSGSGTNGREDETGSDSTHETLYIESKLRDRHTVRTLHDGTKKKAAKERKTPVVVLFDKQRPGCLIVVHSDDLMTVVAEYAAALPSNQRDRLEGLIRQAYARQQDRETV